jgi:hypothetical protein
MMSGNIDMPKIDGVAVKSLGEYQLHLLLKQAGIVHRYESPECTFADQGFRYTIDFYLPESKVFLEYKCARPSQEEYQKIYRVIQLGLLPAEHRIVLCFGDVSVWPVHLEAGQGRSYQHAAGMVGQSFHPLTGAYELGEWYLCWESMESMKFRPVTNRFVDQSYCVEEVKRCYDVANQRFSEWRRQSDAQRQQSLITHQPFVTLSLADFVRGGGGLQPPPRLFSAQQCRERCSQCERVRRLEHSLLQEHLQVDQVHIGFWQCLLLTPDSAETLQRLYEYFVSSDTGQFKDDVVGQEFEALTQTQTSYLVKALRGWFGNKGQWTGSNHSVIPLTLGRALSAPRVLQRSPANAYHAIQCIHLAEWKTCRQQMATSGRTQLSLSSLHFVFNQLSRAWGAIESQFPAGCFPLVALIRMFYAQLVCQGNPVWVNGVSKQGGARHTKSGQEYYEELVKKFNAHLSKITWVNNPSLVSTTPHLRVPTAAEFLCVGCLST